MNISTLDGSAEADSYGRRYVQMRSIIVNPESVIQSITSRANGSKSCRHGVVAMHFNKADTSSTLESIHQDIIPLQMQACLPDATSDFDIMCVHKA